MSTTKDIPALLKSSPDALEKLKVGDLKTFLKGKGLSQTGEKGTLMFRIKAFVDGENYPIEGKNPACLKAGELKKECAKRGLSPMGYPDELLESLMGWLKKNGVPSSGGGGGGKSAAEGGEGKSAAAGAAGAAAAGGGGGGGGGDDDVATSLVHRIMELAEEEDWGAILSLGVSQEDGGKLTRQSPTAVLRKAYHCLSRNVHPDRLGGIREATRAFQAVVTAFERLSEPEMEEEEKETKGGKKKAKALARSNENCFKTKIYCPRCKTEWGQAIDGLPDYCYNYMQMGLRTYCCSTCLCDFGCVTAIHKCPHCKRPFEYDPHDYHRQVVCGNKGCTKPFGFYCFPVSERVEKEMRTELKVEQEKRLKARETKLARLARSKRKAMGEENDGEAAENDMRLKLRLFVQGLLDACPRCGEEPECVPEDREGHKEHLRGCKDKKKIAAHQKKLKTEEAVAAVKEAKQTAQEDMQSLRTWEFLGGKEGEMWLLTDDQLARQCREKGILPEDDKGKEEKLSKDQMIAQLVAHGKGQLMLTHGGEKGTAKNGGMTKRLTRDSLPGNLYTLSISQLKCVCAAHGFFPSTTTQGGIIREMEQEVARAEGHEETLLLEDQGE